MVMRKEYIVSIYQYTLLFISRTVWPKLNHVTIRTVSHVTLFGEIHSNSHLSLTQNNVTFFGKVDKKKPSLFFINTELTELFQNNSQNFGTQNDGLYFKKKV